MDARVDYYAVLGVSSSASAEAIKEAYRRLIKQHHPDLNPGSQEALDKTKELNRAYDILGDSETRTEYDRQRTGGSVEAGEAARRRWEAEKRARAAEWVAREAKERAERERRAGRRGREAARKAEEEQRARESASKDGGKRPTQETEGHKTDGGSGQHRGSKQILRCLILTFLVLLIAGGVVGGYLALPYIVDEGEESAPNPTFTTAPPTALPSTPTPQPTATPVPSPTPVPFPLPPDVQSAATDREALVRLYEATDGSNWTDNRNWLTDAPLKEWYGVDTDPDGRVTLLYLIDNNLDGVLPIELLNMGKLGSLLLEGNRLSGCIAEELQAAIYDDDLHTLGLPTCSVMPTPVPSPTPVPTATPIPTATPVPSPTPVPTATPIPTPKPTATARSLKLVGEGLLDSNEIERWIIDLTNEERQRAGLDPLVHDSAISDIARLHSQNMVDKDRLSHYIGGQGPTDRALDKGYDCRAYSSDGSYTYGLSENIAKYPRVREWYVTQSSARLVSFHSPGFFYRNSRSMAHGLIIGWMNSPGHRENILDRDAHRIGIGVAIQENEKYGYVDEVVFATQNFSGCR